MLSISLSKFVYVYTQKKALEDWFGSLNSKESLHTQSAYDCKVNIVLSGGVGLASFTSTQRHLFEPRRKTLEGSSENRIKTKP